jgi:hypothetical protein
MSESFLAYIVRNHKLMRLRQMLCCLHGTVALLIAHPKTYGLTKQKGERGCRVDASSPV